MYKRNFVKLNGNEKCPLHYLIPKSSNIKNVYEVVGCMGSYLDKNYKTISLKDSGCFIKLNENLDYKLTDRFFQYTKNKCSENISIYLIIEYK